MNSDNFSLQISLEAAQLISKLMLKYGPLIFYISSGCCDGTGPVCLPADEFFIDDNDVIIGEVCECLVYTSKDFYPYVTSHPILIDVAKGIGSSFSVEIPEGFRFKLSSQSCQV